MNILNKVLTKKIIIIFSSIVMLLAIILLSFSYGWLGFSSHADESQSLESSANAKVLDFSASDITSLGDINGDGYVDFGIGGAAESINKNSYF